jgi:hypothetical protein
MGQASVDVIGGPMIAIVIATMARLAAGRLTYFIGATY